MDFTVDGLPVHAATGGRPLDPAQPVAVFLHGAAMDHTNWSLQTRYFAHHGRSVLAVDLPGHGRSGGAAMDDIGGLADWLIRLLDAAGVEQTAIVGHSMGGLVALEAAARYPVRVRSLALLGVSVPMVVNERFLSLAEANDPRAFEMMMGWSFARKSQIGGHSMPGLQMVSAGMRLVERARPGVLYASLEACNGYENGEAAAEAVQCPVLVVLGERDLMAPARAGRRLAERFRDARVMVLPKVGHIMMVEAPEALLRALEGAI